MLVLQGITWSSAMTIVNFAHDTSPPYCLVTAINIFHTIQDTPQHILLPSELLGTDRHCT